MGIVRQWCDQTRDGIQAQPVEPKECAQPAQSSPAPEHDVQKSLAPEHDVQKSLAPDHDVQKSVPAAVLPKRKTSKAKSKAINTPPGQTFIDNDGSLVYVCREDEVSGTSHLPFFPHGISLIPVVLLMLDCCRDCFEIHSTSTDGARSQPGVVPRAQLCL